MYKKQYLYFTVLSLCLLALTACHKDEKSKKIQQVVVTAKLKTPVEKLFFSGILSPIKTTPVISPVSGNVEKMNFNYGDRVKKGQLLLVVDSKALAKSYRDAVQSYLQKKRDYNTNKNSFIGTKALYKAGVIPRDQYLSEQTAYDNAALGYLQAQYNLKKILRKVNVDEKKIESLSLSDTQAVNDVLEKQFRHIQIHSTGNGVALYPIPRHNQSGGTTSGKIYVGDAIKEGQLLLSIGDLKGLSASFDVSEVDIDRMHRKMKVIVTGDAFPGVALHGYISSVSSQAKQGFGGGASSVFPVSIVVPTVDPKVMTQLRVGMTAKFEIQIDLVPHIELPVGAVSHSNGQDTVTILTKKNVKKIVPVLVGQTTENHVVIISGIKPGDKVVFNQS